MLAKLLNKNVFEKIKRSEWLKIKKENKLKIVVPHNLNGEEDSMFSIRNIVDSLSGSKIDFMYSIILSKKGSELIPKYIEKGLLWLMK